jgi:hypothetical protein
MMPDSVPAHESITDRIFGSDNYFGAFEVDGNTIFFKIDYYDKSLTCHSPNAADKAVTERVITIMLAQEY